MKEEDSTIFKSALNLFILYTQEMKEEHGFIDSRFPTQFDVEICRAIELKKDLEFKRIDIVNIPYVCEEKEI